MSLPRNAPVHHQVRNYSNRIIYRCFQDTLADTLAEQNTRLQNYEQLIDQQKIEIEELKDQIERSLACAGGNSEHLHSEISLLKKQNQQFRSELEKNVAKIYKLQDAQADLM